MKKFMVYVDDGDNCFKRACAADDVKGAYRQFEGAGEVISVRPIDDVLISEDYLEEVLDSSRFGKTEKQIILSALREMDIIC